MSYFVAFFSGGLVGTTLAWRSSMKGLSQQQGQREAASERLRLFVVETGSSPLSGERANEFDETTAITQMQDEQPLAFAHRVLDRVAAAERSGRRFQSAVVLIGSRGDIASNSARRLIALGLAAHGEPESTFELALEANPGATEHARDQLLGLVEELTFAASPLAMPVRLRFGASSEAGRPPNSGVFWSAPPSRS